jgi:hypothetical protein
MLPLREIVLYKSGVGFFTREGDVEGESVTLTFRQDEVNDILKSLAVFDQAGGRVTGIHYQTPMDQEDSLVGNSIRLSEYGSLYDLLRELRGRRVTLTFEPTPGHTEIITGRLIGVDNPTMTSRSVSSFVNTDPIGASAVMIMDSSNQVSVYRLNLLRGIKINDEQAERDLTQVLDTSLTEESRRTITVNLSEGKHHLLATYVAPSSSWRVSYRLVAESNEEGTGGKAYLQGWGLFDNRMGEDLDGVKVTLVVGQPISFVYDLSGSYVPKRAQVADAQRIAPGPVDYEADYFSEASANASMDFGEMPYAAQTASAGKSGGVSLPRGGFSKKIMTASKPSYMLSQSTPVAAQGTEMGEFFQYEITEPISVKRGESALVPIVGAEIAYERELLYNRSKLADHPVVALRFTNTAGLILERGPVTVVENEVYKGEAIVPLTRPDNPIYLPYAVESGVKVVERTENSYEIVGYKFDAGALTHQRYQLSKTTYALQNITAKAVTVMIEAPIKTGLELYQTREPDVQTLTERRWKIEIPANGKAEFIRTERLYIIRHILGFPTKTTVTG